MEKVYLTDIGDKILEELAKSKNQVIVAMAWFTNPYLFEGLLECQKRGVLVKLIILDDAINRNDDFGLDFNPFICKYGELRLYSTSDHFMHNKYCVIDDTIAITGSYNWTKYAETRNLENILITDNHESIVSYKKGFQKMWDSLSPITTYEQIPASSITRDSYSGNYMEYEYERTFCRVSQMNIKTPFTTLAVREIANRQNPTSKYYIGLHAHVSGDDNGMKTLICKGDKLPSTIALTAWNNKDNITDIPCEIYYGDNPNTIVGNTKLVSLNLKVPPRKTGELHFKTSITLVDNGYLHLAFTCVETGEGQETSVSNKNLINYK
jgi:hypothetical protein